MAKGFKTGGRLRGTLNKATADIRALASEYTPLALSTLARIMETGESESAQVAAAREVLDRAYGKSKQPIVGGEDGDPVLSLSVIERRIVRVETNN